VHDNALGGNCASCHDTKAWDKAPGFDHDKSDYPLDGKHVDVACEKCHLSPTLKTSTNSKGKRIPLCKPVAHKECAACHADPHKGRLSARCSECHVTRGFAVVDKRDFNHALTRYPLRGEHLAVSCDGCHGKDLARKNPPYSSCGSCHGDAHGGEATLGGQPADCAACHRVEGFAPSTFTVAQHRQTKYPLAGKHTAVRCAACHGATRPGLPAWSASLSRGSAGVMLTGLDPACTSCHVDPHAGRYSRPGGAAGDGTCRACHGSDRFRPSRVDVAAHAQYSFSLDGAHRAVPCVACHEEMAALPPATTVAAAGAWGTVHPTLVGGGSRIASLPFAPAGRRNCGTCHASPHGDQFRDRPSGGDCASCHSLDAFAPATLPACLDLSRVRRAATQHPDDAGVVVSVVEDEKTRRREAEFPSSSRLLLSKLRLDPRHLLLQRGAVHRAQGGGEERRVGALEDRGRDLQPLLHRLC
jgi:hypothetical protein